MLVAALLLLLLLLKFRSYGEKQIEARGAAFAKIGGTILILLVVRLLGVIL